jgi:hypothetical protein
MKESYREGVASHSGPKPCEGGGNVALEALDRGICRLRIELRNRQVREPTASDSQEGHIAAQASLVRQKFCNAPLEDFSGQTAWDQLGYSLPERLLGFSPARPHAA